MHTRARLVRPIRNIDQELTKYNSNVNLIRDVTPRLGGTDRMLSIR